MNSVYFANGLRTYLGAKNKIYRNVPAEELASEIIRKLNDDCKKKSVSPEIVIAGNATCGGGNIARLSLLKAELEDSHMGITIDAQCASGMESIISSYARIKSGINSAIIAGGTESASTKCIRQYNPNHPNFYADKGQNAYESAQFIPEDFSENSMLAGADETCRKHGINQEDMIQAVLKSHDSAVLARNSRSLEKIILPCFNATKDELIRESLTEGFIKRLKPIIPNGIINSATSCLFSDGAAFVTLCNSPVDFFGTGSAFKIKAVADTGDSRFLSPESLIAVISKIIKTSGLKESQIDRIDYNQAFACLDILYERHFNNPSNAYGGALAYGHPYGASGTIILLHLLCAMEQNHEKYGIAAIPAAGGVASAILVERI